MKWTVERAKQYGRNWYKSNRVEQLAKAKRRHAANPVARRQSWQRCRFKKYGLTLDGYERMLHAQNHCCAICGVNEIEAPRGFLCVDHDHKTMKARALLCNNCNALIGLAKESIRVLNQAATYIALHLVTE